MLKFLVLILLAAQAADDPATKAKTPRKTSTLAPSLPELTDAEEAEFDRVIDRFIEYDSGGRKDPDGKKILGNFQKLSTDAIPALIRGINRAAKIDHSCPALIIGKKLERMLRSTHDPELLEFARENIGAGVEQSLHMGVLKQLRVVCIFRKSQLARAGDLGGGVIGLASPTHGARDQLKKLSITDLVEAAGKERGDKLKQILTELGQRKGDQVISALGTAAAASYERDVQKLARDLLDRQLSGLAPRRLRKRSRTTGSRCAWPPSWLPAKSACPSKPSWLIC